MFQKVLILFKIELEYIFISTSSLLLIRYFIYAIFKASIPDRYFLFEFESEKTKLIFNFFLF